MAGDLAEQAYGHCLTVLGDPDAAADAAIAALRRAGRSRSSVLAHARHQALSRAKPAAPDPSSRTPDGVAELATRLAATRPATERAVLDLRARLDRADLGRALGLSSTAAVERAEAVAQAWDEQLDPQLMAALGPGDCVELAAVLADLPTTTLADLAAAGPATAGHMDACETCRDRRRAMVSVRSLLGQPVGDVPSAVKDAARGSRRMRPAQPPPPLEPRRRRPLVIAAVATAIVAAIAVAGATAAAITDGGSGRADRVADLVRPASARLAMTVRGDVVEITNLAARHVRWRASADARWLEVTPIRGELGPGATASLSIRVLRNSPEGALRSMITVSGDDGSAAAAVYATNVERPPDLATATEGCEVVATVEDSSGVAEVVLHVSGAATTQMTPREQGYVGRVPAGSAVWSVAATDTRGNQARSPESRSDC